MTQYFHRFIHALGSLSDSGIERTKGRRAINIKTCLMAGLFQVLLAGFGYAHENQVPTDLSIDSDAVRMACESQIESWSRGDLMFSAGFDNAIEVARSEPWAKDIDFDDADSASRAGCYKAIALIGLTGRYLELRLGETPSGVTPDPEDLPYTVAHTATLAWPALVMIEKFGLLSEQKDTAQAAQESWLNGLFKLIERGASADCMTEFVYDQTAEIHAMDLAGRLIDKKQMLVDFSEVSDAGVGSMINQCLPSLPESCSSVCN